MQDLLGLGQDGRMNTPGTIDNNWNWQITPGRVTSAIARKLRKTTIKTRRSTP
jgi:4-alpha-glucanotransferase